ncbi:MAG: ABC-F family ATP-binding cassette domain-containing protein [Verrucomicrobiota bacterium]
MITLHDISKSFGGRKLFDEAKMTINWGDRIALVGPNGAGKSTLFNIILEQDFPDDGYMERDEYAVVGYLPQEPDAAGDETPLDIATAIDAEMEKLQKTMKKHEVAGTTDDPEYAEAQSEFDLKGGYGLEPKAKGILRGLAFREEDMTRPVKELSGGWIMRAHLAKLLVLEPDLLMLDEPTNHLDLLSLLWFQKHLQKFGGAILVISHDRDFLDAIAENVYDIANQKIVRYKGNYSKFEKEKAAGYEKALAAWKNQQKEVDKVRSFIQKFQNVTSKASQVQNRKKTLEKMEKIEKPARPRKGFHFHFPEPPRGGQRCITLENVTQAYGDHVVYQGLDLTVEKGEKTVLIGPNGAGKSTLIKILADAIPIQEGKRIPGHNLQLGYFSQHRTESLNPKNTVVEEVLSASEEIREADARSVLGSFLFRKDDVFKKVEVLSGGEKSRLNLVKFLVNPPNLLLMDEPTTHLDLMSVEALIAALTQYTGTLVFISHDVYFIRKLATKVLHIDRGAVTPYAGDYQYYLDKTGAGDDARAAVTATKAEEGGKLVLENRQAG